MKFTSAKMPAEFADLHPELRQLLVDLDLWTRYRGMAELTLTDIARTPADQERVYAAKWRDLVYALERRERLGREERKRALALRQFTEEQRRAKARARWSWHLCGCAADLRVFEYLPHELDAVKGWLAERARKPMWLWLHELRPAHLHIERQDFQARSAYEHAQRTQAAKPPEVS